MRWALCIAVVAVGCGESSQAPLAPGEGSGGPINVGGSKISPELMEEQILAFSQVRDVGVTGIVISLLLGARMVWR